MTEAEILKIVTDYFTSHWKEVLLAAIACLTTVVSCTWLVCKLWYSREIEHLKTQIDSQSKLHSERIGVLQEKVDERTIYAKGLVELSEQRVLAIEEEKKDLSKQISQHEQELIAVRGTLARMGELERENEEKDVALVKQKSLVREIIVVLEFTVHRSKRPDKTSESFTKLIELLEKEMVSVRVLSAFLLVISEITETAIRAVLETHLSTEKLARFHKSYYKSIKNIVSPVADEQSLKDLDRENQISNEPANKALVRNSSESNQDEKKV